MPGLMLAWHCYRAGRPVEAEPYLLRGSREAMSRGASFEVELALTSAMKGLTPESVAEAQLLLAEALQEQHRHPEALRLLKGCVHEATPNNRKRLLTVRSTAAMATGEEEMRATLAALEAMIISDATVSERIAALEVAQVALFYLGNKGEAERYLAWAQSLEPHAVDLEDEARLGTSVALCSWLSRKRTKIPCPVRALARTRG